MTRMRLAFGAAVLAGLMAPLGMAASGPRGYSGEGERIQSELHVQSAGTLPFTGIELGIYALFGALLIAAGAGLYRAGRKKA
jgi:LPXTG-motif cell wall-anchored protein